MKRLAGTMALAIWALHTIAIDAQSAGAGERPAPLNTVPVAIPIGSRVGDFAISGYDDGGRRDPFASLVVAKRVVAGDAPSIGGRPRTGLAALVLADITVRGIVKNGDMMLAILEGPSKRSFVVHIKDRLLDAVVQTIDRQGVTFAEQVEGGQPSALVRKLLRPAGEELP